MKVGLTPTQTLYIPKRFIVNPTYYKIKGKIRRKHEIAIILPTYCEAENIKRLIEQIQNLKIDPLILVIDDSSPDGTSKIVEELQRKYSNILLVVRPGKMGLGTAITDAFKILLSLKNKPKYIITMDADFSHNPKDIPRLVSLAKKGYDLVLGSRYCMGGKVRKWSPIRILISKIANKLAATLLNIKVNDCTSGFRCYSIKFLKRIIKNLHSQTYEIQIETVRQAVKNGFLAAEIPITFTNRKLGKSKLTLNEITHFVSFITKANLEHHFNVSMRMLTTSTHRNRFEETALASFNSPFLGYIEYAKKLNVA